MAIERIEREGDFVIKGGGGAVAFRFRALGDAFEIHSRQAHILMTDGEATELMGWLKRRFEEPARAALGE